MSDLGELLKQDPPPTLTPDAVLSVLRRGPATLADLAERFQADMGVVEAILLVLRDRGANIHLFGSHWSLAKQPAPSASQFVYRSRPDNTFVFGVSSDQHLGSKYERLDVLNNLYAWFAARGVDRVFNAGNWIEGDDLKTQHDTAVHGLEPQIDYLVSNYPSYGLETYAVWGEDHEGWYARRESIDVGRFAERKMREAGRTDWHDLGFMESAITLENANTGKTAPPLVVMHPGGGTAYALSYRPQKLVESLQGGEKPSVLLIGHYHKMSVNLIRSVWAIQAGCFTGNTRITTVKGPKSIRDIRVGDRVLTHTGQYRDVTETMKRPHRGDLVSVNYGRKGRLDQTLTATPEHPLRIRRDGVDVWVEIADVRVGDGVHVETVDCSICGDRVPYWMKMCVSCNPMHDKTNRDKLAAVKGGPVLRRGGSCGEKHLVADVVPFCEAMQKDGWKIVPVGAGVIPDAIGYKDGRLVAFELERAGKRTRLRAHKERKYEASPITSFVDEVRWVDLTADAAQPRGPYEIDEHTGFAIVPVLSVTRKPARWGRGSAVSVYNFEVEEHHSYVAGRVVVHNCTQDQTPFMRKIPTEPHIGGAIVTLEQDPETGAIYGCTVAQRQFFNKAYENSRWSKSGPVVKPEKVMLGPKE